MVAPIERVDCLGRLFGARTDGGGAMTRHAERDDEPGEALLAHWEMIGVESMRADVCVSAVSGKYHLGRRELCGMLLAETSRISAALRTQREGLVAERWIFAPSSFVLEWLGAPPTIPALGAAWCDLVVDAAPEHAGEEAALEHRWHLSETGRPIAAGRLAGRLTPAPRPNPVRSSHRERRIAPEAVIDAVLQAIESRAPDAQIQLLDIAFIARAEGAAQLTVELEGDPDRRLTAFAIHEDDGRTLARARVGLVDLTQWRVLTPR